MKSRDLINLLQTLDPSGETEVCVGNLDITHVDREPAYYDGACQVLIKDNSNQIVGGKYVTKGYKIVIHYNSIDYFVGEFADLQLPFEVDYSNLTVDAQKTKEKHKLIIQQNLELHDKIELDIFKNWVRSKIPNTYDRNDLDDTIEKFFKDNLNYSLPLPAGNGSYSDRRMEQWENSFEIVQDLEFIDIRKK